MNDISELSLRVAYSLDNGPKSTAKLARILRRHSNAITTSLRELKKQGYVDQNNEWGYFLLPKGLDLIQEKFKKDYFTEVREHVLRLKARPGRREWWYTFSIAHILTLFDVIKISSCRKYINTKQSPGISHYKMYQTLQKSI